MGRVPNGVGDVVLQPEGNAQVLEENQGIIFSNDKGKGQTLGSTDNDASRATKDVVNGSSRLVQLSDGREQVNQKLQGPAIRWDRFLPVRSLKVLLVENDYSTRHVVSALLRNCSYEVTAVANGMQAWRILGDLSNHIDLILTEVAMPIISGIGLLSKIMNHKTFKNIPVIMMSNHDSMGIVFKCLSKGAVDFLVKPIRKNELKNLWQHVWRRCHSSSGSGSESGTQSRRSSRSKSINDSKNNSSSSDERENGSMGLSLRDGSDEGSGAQSSWTKKECEIVSPHATRDQLEEAPDSTCAQVIITKSETIGNKGHATEVRECEQSDAQLDSVAMGKDLELGLSRSVQAALHHQLEKSAQEPNNNAEYSLVHCKPLEHQQLVVTENVRDDMRNHGSHIVSVKLSSTNQQVQGRNSDKLINEQARVDLEGCRSLELGLEKLREGRDIRADTHEDHNVLRHSDLSAFSKYTSVAPHNQPMISKKQVLIGNVGSCSLLDSSSVAITTETMHYYLSQSSSTPPNQQSNESTNKNDMVSTMRNDVPKVENLNDKSESTSVFKSFHTSSQAVQNECSLLQSKAGNVADATSNEVQAQPRNSHQVHVEHHHHHYHHYHHHVQSHQASKVHNESTLKNAKATVPQCGSSNVISGQIEGSAVNFSLNGSVSGSNQGSNGKIGSQNALNAGPTNMGCDNATAGNSNSGGLSKTSGYGSDEDRFAKREAALTKFRQKRKERCFEKKVRYQSRKKLAEQRPRVRGQFVRQQVVEAKAGQDAQSDDLISGDNSWDSMQ